MRFFRRVRRASASPGESSPRSDSLARASSRAVSPRVERGFPSALARARRSCSRAFFRVALSSFWGLPVLFLGRSLSFASTLAICSLRAALKLARAALSLAAGRFAAVRTTGRRVFLRATIRTFAFSFFAFAMPSSLARLQPKKAADYTLVRLMLHEEVADATDCV